MEPREVKVGETVLYKVTANDAKNYAEQISKAGFFANTHDEGQVVPSWSRRSGARTTSTARPSWTVPAPSG